MRSVPRAEAMARWSPVRWLTGLLVLAGAVFCGVIGVRTALAEWQSDHNRPAAALRLRGDVAQYDRELAGQSFDPHSALALTERATALNPLDPQNWLQQAALVARLQGIAASRSVLERGLAAVGGFDLRLQAAAYAHLEGQAPEFWRELSRALRPLRVSSVNPALTRQRVQQVLDLAQPATDSDRGQLAAALAGSDPAVLLVAVDLLLRQGDVATADVLWRVHRCPPLDRDSCAHDAVSLANAGLLAAGLPDSGASVWPGRALAVWNQAVERRLLLQSPAAVGKVTDGNFRFPWLGLAFSWADDATLPLQWLHGPGSPPLVNVDFDGDHAGPMRLFHQWILLQPGHAYRISYQVGFLPGGAAGFFWELESAAGDRLAEIPMRTPASLQASSASWLVPPAPGPLILAAAYQRPLGQLPARGSLQIAFVQFQQEDHP